LVSNRFENKGGDRRDVVSDSWIVANSAIYMGNSSKSQTVIQNYSKSGREVANLNISIEVQCNDTKDSPFKEWP